MDDRSKATILPSSAPSSPGMRRSCLAVPLAGIALLSFATPTIGQQLCKPELAFKEVRFSEVQALQRIWTGILSVDASRCAATSGGFEIAFVRAKENGIDLDFSEQFTWTPGQTEVSVDFWWDEAVQHYRIVNVAACPCRD